VRRRSITVTSSTLIVQPAGELHANRYGSGPARCVIVELQPVAVARLSPGSNLLLESHAHESSKAFAAARRIYAEFRRRDSVSHLVVESEVLELTAEAHRLRERTKSLTGRPNWIWRLIDRLRADGGRHAPRGLSELASEVGLHPSHVARAFRRSVGCSVGEYQRIVRLEEAARLLRTTDIPLSALALAAGFSDQSHFSNAFVRRYGTPPGSYRRAARAS